MSQVWNLKYLFQSDDDPEILKYRTEVNKKVDKFCKKWNNDKIYLENPEKLKEALEEYEQLEIVGPSGGDGAGTKDSFYFWLRSQLEQNNTDIKAKYNQSIDFGLNLSNKLRFFKLGLSKIDKSKQNLMISYLGLKKYKHFLERTFLESPYLLSEKEEKILALKQMPAHEMWDQLVSSLLSKQKHIVLTEKGKEEKSFTEITQLLNSTNKEVRDDAARVFNMILEKYAEIAEGEINALLANKKVDDELRNLSRPDLARHISDDIESEVVDALIEGVSKHNSISSDFYKLKAKLFGVSKLEYHERNVSYGKVEKEYSFEKASMLVKKVFAQLDPEFEKIFESFLKDGRIDVNPKAGKRSGAFCTDSLKYQPVYIMLNHTGLLRDVSTLAHELGHGINGELMKRKLSTLDAGMSLATAEVASTFMEDFVFKELLKDASEEERLSLLHDSVQDSITTIIRQVACYEFERDLHKAFREKGYLSSEEIGKLFQKRMAGYMGPAIEQSKGSQNWWIHWHHIRSFFYVYSYASGLLISKALQRKVRENPEFINKVKEFLSAGMSLSPIELFKHLGLDITKPEFWEFGMQEVKKELKEFEELAIQMGKI